MGNEGYTTGRTPQTSINNQHKQSKARHKLDRTIIRYKELNTRKDSRPKQHKHYIKGKLMTAIAIVIMIIVTASAAANDIGTTTYETYNKEQQLSEKDTVNRIKASTTNEPQNTTQEAYATHAKPRTRTKKHDKTGSESNAKHNTGKEQRRICAIALLKENYRQARGNCRKVRQTRQIGNNKTSSGTEKNTMNKVTTINHTQEAPNNEHTNQKPLTTKEKHSRKNTKQHHGLRKRPPRGHYQNMTQKKATKDTTTSRKICRRRKHTPGH
jgi:hypothetical protein